MYNAIRGKGSIEDLLNTHLAKAVNVFRILAISCMKIKKQKENPSVLVIYFM